MKYRIAVIAEERTLIEVRLSPPRLGAVRILIVEVSDVRRERRGMKTTTTSWTSRTVCGKNMRKVMTRRSR